MTEKIVPPHFLKPFPSAENVFAKDVALHRKHLLPLATIKANALDAGLPPSLHFVSPKESYDGLVGERSPEYNNQYCEPDILAFRVGNDGKYTFLSDFRYFFVEKGVPSDDPNREWRERELPEFLNHYDRVENNYAKAKQFFASHGVLNPNGEKQPNRQDNWISVPDKPGYYNGTPPSLPNNVTPKFVAQITGYSYYDSGPTNLLLFFEPKERIAVIQLDHD